MLKRTKDKRVLQFLKLLKRLEMIEIVGIARLLQVQLVIPEESGPAIERDSDSILYDLIDAFIAESSSKQKFILELMRAATKEE